MAQPYYHNGNRKRVEQMTRDGMTGVEIARRLNITPATVYRHRAEIRKRDARRAMPVDTTDQHRI